MNWTWDLSVLYSDFNDPQIEKDFSSLKEICENMKNMMQGDALTALENMADAFEEMRENSKIFILLKAYN